MQATSAETLSGSIDQDTTSREIGSDLSPADFQPPFLLRLGSAIIDYIVLLILPLTGLLSEKLVGGSGFGVFSDRTLWFLRSSVSRSKCRSIAARKGPIYRQNAHRYPDRSK